MRRTQLYLDEDMWQALHVRARESRSTISELVRQAIRESAVRSTADRKKAMEDIVGLWAGRSDIGDPTAYVRKLRKGSRLDRLK